MWGVAKVFSVLVVCQAFVCTHADQKSKYVKYNANSEYIFSKNHEKCSKIRLRQQHGKFYTQEKFDENDNFRCQNCCSSIVAPFYSSLDNFCICLTMQAIEDRWNVPYSSDLPCGIMEVTAVKLGIPLGTWREKPGNEKIKIYNKFRRQTKNANSGGAGTSNQVQDSHSIRSQSTEQGSGMNQGKPATWAHERFEAHGEEQATPVELIYDMEYDPNVVEHFWEQQSFPELPETDPDWLAHQGSGMQQGGPASAGGQGGSF